MSGVEAPPNVVRIPGGAALAEGESKTFEFERGGKRFEAFLLHHRNGFFAYANSCPHWAVDLDLGFGDFYASDMDRIVCKNHGALFIPETGECSAGPCAGMYLERFDVELEGEDAVIVVGGITIIDATNLVKSSGV